MNLKLDLNNKQREAVLHKNGPALVLAGAGSGKTRVITYRIANLIKEGISPEEILTVTFTNKAAEEMSNRVKKIVYNDLSDMWIGTFHSCCLKILRNHLDKIGYKPNYIIYDSDDSISIVKDSIKELNLDKNIYDSDKIYKKIAKAKMNLISYKEYVLSLHNENQTPYYEDIAQIYKQYEKKLLYNNAFDFTDLIVKTIYLFRKYPDILKKYQNKFRYIQCDEYQDTNHSQYIILNMLSSNNNNLFAVGDPDQSIYNFRGANIRNILDFENDYRNAKIIKLEKNYRSTSNIVNASNAVIENNLNRRSKVAYTDAHAGCPIIICEADNSYAEADFVAKTIQSMVRNKEYNYKDITILYRSNYQSQAFESKFVEIRIPYIVVNGIGFFNRKEVKDLLAFLRLAVNINDTPSLIRIIALENSGIGPVTVSRLQEYSFINNISLMDTIQNPTVVKGIGKIKEKAILDFKERMLDPINKIIENNNYNLQEKIFHIYQAVDYNGILLKNEDTYEKCNSNIEAFFEFVNNYCHHNMNNESITDFLQNIRLMSDQDNINNDENKVKMMTIHAAKGLEYPVIFVVGMEEGTFPHRLCMNTEEEIEEERRLAYVAMTRAKNRLFLSYCNARFQFFEFVPKTISRFIEEVPLNYYKKIRIQSQSTQYRRNKAG